MSRFSCVSRGALAPRVGDRIVLCAGCLALDRVLSLEKQVEALNLRVISLRAAMHDITGYADDLASAKSEASSALRNDDRMIERTVPLREPGTGLDLAV